MKAFARQALIITAFLALAVQCIGREWDGRITVDFPDKAQAANPGIYSQFLEHINDSVMNGLYAEMIKGRSFEEETSGHLPPHMKVYGGSWSVVNGELYQKAPGTNHRMYYDSPSFTDCIIELEAKKLDGLEGFIVAFRIKDKDTFYWWNHGGWGNTGTQIQSSYNGSRDLGSRLPAKVETGKWYKLKIRLQGEKIECFVDDEKKIEITDKGGSSGGIGVAVWDTRVVYRNFKVYDLDGKLLYEPTMPKGPEETISTPWKPYGDGDVKYFVDDKAPANSSRSQRIEAEKAASPFGVVQSELIVNKGKFYKGSAYLKSGTAGKTHAEVGLLTSEGKADFVDVGIVGDNWKEYKFSLKATEDSDNASIVVRFKDPGTYWVDQVSLMPADLPQNRPFRADILEKLKAIHPGIISWPGGAFAEYYRWKDGIGPQVERVTTPNKAWGGLDNNGFGTDEFISLCRETRSEPMIALNAGTQDALDKFDSYLKEALEWIEYCNGSADSEYGALRAEHGHPKPYNVKYWYVGSKGPKMNVDEYCRRTELLINAVRSRFPDLKLTVQGSADFDQDWNKAVISKLADKADWIAVSHYYSLLNSWDYWLQMADADRYETYLKELGQIIKSGPNPDIKVAVTGWSNITHALRGGLYAGSLLNAFERNTDFVAMAAPALCVQKTWSVHPQAAMINYETNKLFVSPQYQVMKLFRDNQGDTLLPVKVSSPAEHSFDGTRVPLLNVSASMTRNELILKVVNRDPDNSVRAVIEMPKGMKAAGPYTYNSISGYSVHSENTIPNPSAISKKSGSVDLKAQGWRHVFPARSASVLRIKL